MGQRAIVHIGYHKTATTWFQEVFYPAVRNRRYVARDKVYAAFAAPPAFAFDVERALRLIGRADDAILCEEELSGYLHNGGLSGFASRRIAERLHAAMPEAEIVIFVRAQPAMAAASYLQYVRTGGTYGPSRYLMPWRHLRGAAADPYKAPRFALDHLAYDRLAAHYAALFGRSNVHVFAYEEMAADPAAFAARYAERLGLDVDWHAVTMAKRNVSYGRLSLIVARTLNLFTRRAVIDKHCVVHVPGLYSARRAILEWVNRLPGAALTPDQVLGARLCDEVAERFRESNVKLSRDFGLDLGAWGYPVIEGERVATASEALDLPEQVVLAG